VANSRNHGGPRTPSNPAPASLPGALSQRTDGGPKQVQADLKGGAYGESKRLNELQSAAPLGASPGATAPPVGTPAPTPTALFSPTSRPEEPVTAGVPFGPGDGPDAGGFGADAAKELPDLKARFLPSLLHSADQPNVPASFVRFVRSLRDS